MNSKVYLSTLIGNKYKDWFPKKILLYAPTGMGKTTFIVKSLLPYLKNDKKKMLILCNRRLLREQYWYSLVQEYDDYAELDSIEIKTYQNLAEIVKESGNLDVLFQGYDVIVCDEAHYFYADSDFNGFGTYVLLQAIVYAGYGKEIIFMTATPKEVNPLLVRTIENCREKLKKNKPELKNAYDKCGQIIEEDFTAFADYDRFQCTYLPDQKSLIWKLASSSKKTIVFIDDKEEGEEMARALCATGKITMQEIGILNADNLERNCNTELIRTLAIAHRVIPKILITTAVLDNGVSIHDPDVGNVAIMTESEVDFIQMLGRIRAESVESCNLYFVPRESEVYRLRMSHYEKYSKWFKMLGKDRGITKNVYHYFSVVWDSCDSEEAVFYRKALVMARHKYQYFQIPESNVRCFYGDAGLYMNEFSKKKNGNLYMAESKFFALATENPLKVVHEQLKWIGKAPEELMKMDMSKYHESRKQAFMEVMLSVQNLNQEAFQDFKKHLVKNYRKEFFPDILSKNGTLSNEKLGLICDRYNLQFIARGDSEDRRKYYCIEEKEDK